MFSKIGRSISMSMSPSSTASVKEYATEQHADDDLPAIEMEARDVLSWYKDLHPDSELGFMSIQGNLRHDLSCMLHDCLDGVIADLEELQLDPIIRSAVLENQGRSKAEQAQAVLDTLRPLIERVSEEVERPAASSYAVCDLTSSEVGTTVTPEASTSDQPLPHGIIYQERVQRASAANQKHQVGGETIMVSVVMEEMKQVLSKHEDYLRQVKSAASKIQAAEDRMSGLSVGGVRTYQDNSDAQVATIDRLAKIHSEARALLAKTLGASIDLCLDEVLEDQKRFTWGNDDHKTYEESTGYIVLITELWMICDKSRIRIHPAQRLNS